MGKNGRQGLKKAISGDDKTEAHKQPLVPECAIFVLFPF
jgi:hypothetical protein